MKFWGIFPNNAPEIWNIGILPDCSINTLQMLDAFFLGGSRNAIVDKAVPDIHWVSLKIWYFHESLLSMWPLRIITIII